MMSVWILAIAFVISGLTGCSMFDSDSFVVPGVIDRAIQPNIWLNGTDTGKKTSTGVTVTDMDVVSYGHDANTLARAKLAQYNGGSTAAAITQAGLASGIAGVAIGQGPLAAAGGIAAASLLLQHIFTIVNTPAKANAFQQYIERNVAAENEYWDNLAAETCAPGVVNGKAMTGAGNVYLTRLNNSTILLDKALQMTMPTLDQMQAATASSVDSRFGLGAGCPAPAGIRPSVGRNTTVKPRATVP